MGFTVLEMESLEKLLLGQAAHDGLSTEEAKAVNRVETKLRKTLRYLASE